MFNKQKFNFLCNNVKVINKKWKITIYVNLKKNQDANFKVRFEIF